MEPPLGGAVTGWHRHRHRPGPTLRVDTTEEGGGLLPGHQRGPTPGHQRGLSHGHGHGGVTSAPSAPAPAAPPSAQAPATPAPRGAQADAPVAPADTTNATDSGTPV